MSETLKCPKCGSAILSDNGHVGFCQDDLCSNASGIDLAGYWQSRAVKAETALAVVRGITEEQMLKAYEDEIMRIFPSIDKDLFFKLYGAVSIAVGKILTLINPDGKGEK